MEEVIGTVPLTVRRRVRWADCDPAGVVHTGKFPDYVLSAAHLFRTHLLGPAWHDANREAGFAAPAKALSLVFQSSLWPRDEVDLAVFVGGIRIRTIDLLMQASRADDARPVFMARLTSICVTAADRRVARPWPEPYRDAHAAYREQHAAPQALNELGP